MPTTPPGPKSTVLFGSARRFRRDPIDFLRMLARDYGDVVSFQIGPQPMLLVNCAHCDSIKTFLVGTLYDPRFVETLKACYGQRGVTAPMPFFCKIVPV